MNDVPDRPIQPPEDEWFTDEDFERMDAEEEDMAREWDDGELEDEPRS